MFRRLGVRCLSRVPAVRGDSLRLSGYYLRWPSDDFRLPKESLWDSPDVLTLLSPPSNCFSILIEARVVVSLTHSQQGIFNRIDWKDRGNIHNIRTQTGHCCSFV